MRWVGLALTIWMLLSGAAISQQPVDEVQVEGIQVIGNTLISDTDLRRIVGPHEGKPHSLAELQAIAGKIDELYQERGYLFVKTVLPRQESVGGQYYFQVVEGGLGEVIVEDNERYSSDFIARRFRALLPETGIKQEHLQGALLLLNELPDLAVKAVLRAGAEPETSDVILKAEEDKNWHVHLDYNNFGTRLTGEHRAGIGTEFTSLMTQGDRFLVHGLFAFPSDSTTFFQGHYSAPVGDAGTRLGFTYANGSYTAGQEVAVLDIRGTADIFTLSMEHPLVRNLKHSSDLLFNLSYSDIDNSILGLPLSRDFYASASLGYRGQWRDDHGRTLFGATATKGLGGVKKGDPNISRAGAGSDFFKLNLDLGRVQELAPDLSGVLRGSAQITGVPLFTAEQFALGGPDTVRGYTQAELLGDQAYLASAELRWSPVWEWKDEFQTVFFVDHGYIRRDNPQTGERGSESLTGAGLGFRVQPNQQTRIRLDFGFPISPDTNLRDNAPVIYGQVQTRF